MWWTKMTTVGATNRNIVLTRRFNVHANESDQNDTMHDIQKYDSYDLARGEEEEIADSFTSVLKTSAWVR